MQSSSALSSLLLLLLGAAAASAAPVQQVNTYGYAEFPCRVNTTGSPATSVHALRPEDVKVMGALGDSITAAFGAAATSIINLATEYRGLAWSIGGDNQFEQTLTLGNIVKKFNPAVRGLSLGTGTARKNLNVAVSGAIARDMPGQAREFIAALKRDTSIDYNNDWKVLTIWIGGNDFCSACDGRPENQPAAYADYLEETLDILDAEVPRLFVSVVQNIDVTNLWAVQEGTCVAYHRLVCPCGTSDDETVRNRMSELTKEANTLLDKLVNQPKYEDRTDFAAVIQPFFVETTVPLRDDGTPDRSWFAPDCFHFAVKGHEAAAVALFNNMIEPVGQKARKWSPGEPIKCPSASAPFFYTKRNSVV